MYANKLATAIKVKGKVLREFDDTIYLPFGTEYSIFIKNKNSVRASVKVEIDGTDVTQGVSLVVDPNDEINLERFIKNGNLSKGNRFKFIERSNSITAHRGIKVEDGLVRIEFQFERPIQRLNVVPDHWSLWKSTTKIESPHPGYPQYPDHPAVFYNSTSLHSIAGGSALLSNTRSATKAEVGITAPGSVSNQEFNNVSTFDLESQKYVMIMRLLGQHQHQGKYVTNTVTTRTRSACVTCGHFSKSNAKFCPECGTSLQII